MNECEKCGKKTNWIEMKTLELCSECADKTKGKEPEMGVKSGIPEVGKRNSKKKFFMCTIWDDGTIILTEKLILRRLNIKKEKIKDTSFVSTKFQGSLEELSKNYKQLFNEG